MIPDRTRYSKVMWLDSLDRPSIYNAGENEYFLIDIKGVTVIVNKISIVELVPTGTFGAGASHPIHRAVKTWVLTNPIQFDAEV